MEIKEINLPDGKKVKIWKLNHGFRCDLQGSISKVEAQAKDIKVDIGNVSLMTLVYGIWESEDLGIEKPNDIELGLSSEEVTKRLRKIRILETGGDLLYKEINTLNKEIDGDVVKK